MNLLNIVLLSYFFTQSVCYKFDPLSREIEIVEGQFYIFGIDEFGDTNIVNCTFISDTGHVEAFDVGIQVHPKTTNVETNVITDPRLFKNNVSNFGEDGLCKIKVNNVDDEGPKFWNLSAFEEYEETYITTNFTVKFFYKSKIVAYEIRIYENASLFNHLILPDKLSKCLLKDSETEIELNLNSPRSNRIISSKNSKTVETSKRIFSLGRQLCGFQLVNVSIALENKKQWTLTATNVQGKPYRASFTLRIDSRPWVGTKHSVIAVSLGQSYEMSCSGKIAAFCNMLDPRNQRIYAKDCVHKIWSVTLEHLGIWKCYTGSDEDMVGLDFTTELVIKEQERVETWMNQTADYVHIGCRILNRLAGLVQYCKLEAPNNRLYKLREFAASERYLAIGTSLENAVCSMQIKKPLRNDEKGKWTCEISRSGRDRTGGYIDVGEQPTPPYPKLLKFSTRLNEPLTIACQVPYFSEYCSIKAPNGTTYNMIDVSELRLGKCIFPITQINATDNGIWTCYFARQTGTPDEEIKVDVSVAEVLRYYTPIEADLGSSVELKCSTGGPAIQYCRFISPQGVGYQIQNKKSSDRISYFGLGFEHGECGIKIKNIVDSEKGTWKCVTKLHTNDKRTESEIYAEIQVEVTPSFISGANVGAIGIGTGVVVLIITIIFVIVGVRKFRQRNHVEIESDPSIRQNSNEMDENTIIHLQPVQSPSSSTANETNEEESQPPIQQTTTF